MTVTITYSLEPVRLLDLAQGPADSVDDVIALAGGGFAALGFDSGHLDLDIVRADYSDGGGADDIDGQQGSGALSQLSDGNLVIAYTPLGELPYLEIRTPTGAVVVAPFHTSQSYRTDVVGLVNGNFVVTLDGYPPGGQGQNPGGRWALYNNAGTYLIETPIGGYDHAIAALDDGGFAIAWRGDGTNVLRIAVYNANGTERLAPVTVDSNAAGAPAIAATDDGFAIVYAVSGQSGNDDIGFRRYDSSGTFINFGTLSGGATIDGTPDIARMPGGLLAVSFTYSYISVNDSETVLGIFNTVTNTFEDTIDIVLAGEPITDDTDAPKIAFHDGRIAVFHNNVTDNDVDGEDFLVVRTSTGDDAADTITYIQLDDPVANVMFGNGGADLLEGNIADDSLSGGDGDDFLNGYLGNDTIDGGADSDTIVYNRTIAGVTVNLSIVTAQNTVGAGIDTITNVEHISGSFAADMLTGNGQANRLYGWNGNDRLTGGDGNDTLEGADGTDTMLGGLGDDLYHAGAGDIVSEAAGAGHDTVHAAVSYALGSNLEDLLLVEGTAAANGTGNGLANTITGNSSANTLEGGAGNDTIAGYSGHDSLRGGDGDDDIFGSYNISHDTLDGGAGNDTLLAGRGNDSLRGGDGTDVLSDGYTGGSDTLDGGAGADVMNGYGGSDVFYVDNAADRIYEYADGASLSPTGTDTVYASVSYTIAFADILHLLTGAVNGTGNGLDNEIFGNAAANRLDGRTGADTLHGGGGNDTIGGADTDQSGGLESIDVLDGGAGNDTYLVYAGDTVTELANQGTDTVQTIYTYTLGDHVERLFLTGTLAVDGTGNNLANQLLGNDAANTLTGRDGDDTINGGGGADTLNGGSGLDRLTGGLQRDKIAPGTDSVRDTILFTLIGESTGHTRDVIAGLDLNNEDKIDLPGTVASIAAPLSGALSLATFNANLTSVLNATALPVNSAVLFTPTSGDLATPGMVYLIVDSNGVAGYQANQDWVFQLENHTGTLDTTDFV